MTVSWIIKTLSIGWCWTAMLCCVSLLMLTGDFQTDIDQTSFRYLDTSQTWNAWILINDVSRQNSIVEYLLFGRSFSVPTSVTHCIGKGLVNSLFLWHSLWKCIQSLNHKITMSLKVDKQISSPSLGLSNLIRPLRASNIRWELNFDGFNGYHVFKIGITS